MGRTLLSPGRSRGDRSFVAAVQGRQGTEHDARRARELEAVAFLQITLAAQNKLPWTGGFAIVA